MCGLMECEDCGFGHIVNTVVVRNRQVERAFDELLPTDPPPDRLSSLCDIRFDVRVF